MFPGVGLLQRSSVWVGTGFRPESLFSRHTTPFLLSFKPVFCASTRSSILVRESHKDCGHRRSLNVPAKFESLGLCLLSRETLSRRCALGITEGITAELLSTESRLSPRSLVFELEKHCFSMERVSSTCAEEEPSTELARRFWERSQREAYNALYHPFVVALARGSLHISAFQRYIAQDLYFLGAFSEAYGLAIESTDDLDRKAVLEGLKLGVQDELEQVHLSVSSSDSLLAFERHPATLAYTEFLLGVARGDDKLVGGNETTVLRRRKTAAYTIASMTPCNRLYSFLGQEIKSALKGDTSSSPYAQWIETYASVEFGSTALQSEQLVHGFAMPFPGKIDVDAMERLYRRAMELEVGFFAAQEQPPMSTNGRPVLVPLLRSELASNSHFVLTSDFDSTCTVSDSCPVLADLSVSILEKEMSSRGQDSIRSVKSLRSQWDSLVDHYTKDFTQLLDRLLAPKELSPREKGQEERVYDLDTTRYVLEALAELEITANKRVVDSGVLSGLRLADVRQAGGTIPFREGCNDLLKRISADCLQLDLNILSVCWSRSIIEGAFLEAGLQVCNIYSNELELDNLGVTTGNIVRRLETAVDKENWFIDNLNRIGEKLQGRRAFTVYVGDSLTDLLCLLRADIGIVVGESSSLKRVAKASGITIIPLYSGLVLQQEQLSREEGAHLGSWTKVEGVLYRISNWHELHAFLLGS